jgi:hypothetical protein
MELITSLTFTNSFTNEHLVTVAIYKSELGYAILSEFGANLTGVTRISQIEAYEYYEQLIQDTRKAYRSMEIRYSTK